MKRLLMVVVVVMVFGVGNAMAQDSDGDGVPDTLDNCPTDFNPNQEDSYPPGGNNCGDACDCEGNFNSDIDNDVDGADRDLFLLDYGRTNCIFANPCNGDFDCDGDVDGDTEPPYSGDYAKFMEDFGRYQFNNPCPTHCVTDPWCVYSCQPPTAPICEGDFDFDQDVDATDVTTFLDDFGREEYWNPCTYNNPCDADFDCDADVDADDTTTFLEDFGREPYYNPCPGCVERCQYPCIPTQDSCVSGIDCCSNCCCYGSFLCVDRNSCEGSGSYCFGGY